jgi:hypothetical protein
MRTFEHFNASGAPCPICGTNEDKPPVLIPIDGTEDDGIEEAMQVHLECLQLRVKKSFRGDEMMIYQLAEEIKQTPEAHG